MTRSELRILEGVGFLLDTSVFLAFQRNLSDELSSYVNARRQSAPMSVTPVLEGEYLFTARGAKEWLLIEGMCAALQRLPLSASDGEEALAILGELGTEAHMFGAVQITDALVAATALAHDLEIIHNDRDYEHIARVRPALRQRRFRL